MDDYLPGFTMNTPSTGISTSNCVSESLRARLLAPKVSSECGGARDQPCPTKFHSGFPKCGIAMSNPRQRKGDSGASGTGFGCHQILVVDDNRDAADSLAQLFGVMGAIASVAYGAKEALSAMTLIPPRIAFIDIGMPVMNGYELAAQIRASEAFAGVVLIALTGWGHPRELDTQMCTGFDHYLVKPASVHMLEQILGSLTKEERYPAEQSLCPAGLP